MIHMCTDFKFIEVRNSKLDLKSWKRDQLVGSKRYPVVFVFVFAKVFFPKWCYGHTCFYQVCCQYFFCTSTKCTS